MNSFEVFLAARFRDFPILFAATRMCSALWRPSRIVVAVPFRDRAVVQTGLGPSIEVIDENTLLTSLDRESYERRPIPMFPRSFGWYLQQFLKIEYCRQSAAKYCLVWDADTVPLQALNFFDGTGRIYLTKAEEFHDPYFHTFRELFGVSAPSSKSFISQHMFVRCSAMRAMCGLIEERHKVDHWTDALGTILENHPDRTNLFSEYETYANYMLLHHPDQVVTRELDWSRSRCAQAWSTPTKQLAVARAHRLAFVAYEHKRTLCARALVKALENGPSVCRGIAVRVLRSYAKSARPAFLN